MIKDQTIIVWDKKNKKAQQWSRSEDCKFENFFKFKGGTKKFVCLKLEELEEEKLFLYVQV